MRSLVRDGATSEVAIGKHHPSRTRLSISGQKRHGVHVVQKFEARIVEIPQKNGGKNWVFMAKLHKLGFELIPRPPYSPDLAPRNFFLFANLAWWEENLVEGCHCILQPLTKGTFPTG